jgi:hypothetical protein
VDEAQALRGEGDPDFVAVVEDPVVGVGQFVFAGTGRHHHESFDVRGQVAEVGEGVVAALAVLEVVVHLSLLVGRQFAGAQGIDAREY